MREIVLDTETTGFDPMGAHRVVEIGAVELLNRSLTGQTFLCYERCRELSHHRLTTTPTVAKASYSAPRPDRRMASRIVELDHSYT
jgi:DNA polymerase III epsilon subunit-like protein